MTPAVLLAESENIDFTLHEYTHDPAAASFGEEAAELLGVSADRVFKTLVAETQGGDLIVAIVPVSHSLNLKQLAKAAGAKKAGMADGKRVERTTGYVLGGVSPLGQKRTLPTYLDESAIAFDTIFVSAGKRGLEIELTATSLLDLTRGQLATLAGD